MDGLKAKSEFDDACERARFLAGAFDYLLYAAFCISSGSIIQIGSWLRLNRPIEDILAVFTCCVFPLGLVLAFLSLLAGLIHCHHSTGKESAADLTAATTAFLASLVLLVIAFALFSQDANREFIHAARITASELFGGLGFFALVIGSLLWASFIARQARRFEFVLPANLWFATVVGGYLLMLTSAIFSNVSVRRAGVLPDGTFGIALELASRLYLVCFPLLSAMFFYGARRRIRFAISEQYFPPAWFDYPPSEILDPSRAIREGPPPAIPSPPAGDQSNAPME